MKKEFDDDSRVRSAIIAVAVFFLIGIVMSPQLWLKDRFFPEAPLSSFLSTFPVGFTITCSVVLIVALLILVFIPNKFALILSVIACLLLFALDQNRLQPWIYFYFLMLAATLIRSKQEPSSRIVLSSFRFILIALYLWSGIHKFNQNFLNDVFAGVLRNIIPISNGEVLDRLLPLGYVIPAFEVLTGIGLYFAATRKMAIFTAIASHLFILIYLVTGMINAIVIPWNIAMMVLVVLLFYRNNEAIHLFAGSGFLQKASAGAIFILVMILPSFSLFGMWDSYLSFNLYSGKTKELFIAVSDGQFSKLDQRFRKYLLKLPSGMEGGKIISANKWALDELHVPVYPEKRVFETVAKSFCRYGIPNDELIFLISDGQEINEKTLRFYCDDMK